MIDENGINHTWNHRVIEYVDGFGNTYRAIHEVHYNDDVPRAYTENPVCIIWDVDEGNESAKITLERMLRCLEQPVLKPEDFEGEE